MRVREEEVEGIKGEMKECGHKQREKIKGMKRERERVCASPLMLDLSSQPKVSNNTA